MREICQGYYKADSKKNYLNNVGLNVRMAMTSLEKIDGP